MEPFIQDGQYISSYYHPLGLQNYIEKLGDFVVALKEADENIRQFEEICLHVSQAFLETEIGQLEYHCWESAFLLDYDEELGLLAPYSQQAQWALDTLSFLSTIYFHCEDYSVENSLCGEIGRKTRLSISNLCQALEAFHEAAVNFKDLMFNDLKYTISDELWSDIMKKYPHTDCFLEGFQPGVEYTIFVYFKYRFLIPDQLEVTGEPCQQMEDSSSVSESSMSEYVESE